MPMLFIVGTPIGNLKDITARAVETLKSADVILCEDTRVTAKLLKYLDIQKRLFAYHQHSDAARVSEVALSLREGLTVALVSDAGTPGINDPGGKLIAELLVLVPDLQVIGIPGANAAVTALSLSGLPADRYQYWGFVPHKKGRQTFFHDLALCDDTVVFYESKHRIVKALEQVRDVFVAESTPDRPLVVARELTKQFETIYRGNAAIVLEHVRNDKVLGEFVVVVGPKNWK